MHELWHGRGLSPGHNACFGPVHPPVADDRGGDLVECVLTSWPPVKIPLRHEGVAHYFSTQPAAAQARTDKPSDGSPRETLAPPLALDSRGPRDGRAPRTRRGTPPPREPEV